MKSNKSTSRILFLNIFHKNLNNKKKILALKLIHFTISLAWTFFNVLTYCGKFLIFMENIPKNIMKLISYMTYYLTKSRKIRISHGNGTKVFLKGMFGKFSRWFRLWRFDFETKYYRGKAKYLIGVILDPVLAVFKFWFHEIFVDTKYFFSKLCNFTKFLLQQ